MSNTKDLWTKEGKELKGIPWDVYPRPLLKRDSFVNLNGEWDFAVCKKDESTVNYNKKITVPFAPQSLLSGVNELISDTDTVYYKRTFTLPDDFNKGFVYLHFGAVDQFAEVRLNGYLLGSHWGGYSPFSFDVSDCIKRENVIEVKVIDELDKHVLPYGKQKHKRGGMWYTPVTGIWQSVWLESVPQNHITDVSYTVSGDTVKISVKGSENGLVTVNTPDGDIVCELRKSTVEVKLTSVRYWSPEDPYLYYFTVTTDCDKVQSYFAVRTLEIKEINGIKRLCLNGEPYFFHGLLDQGYWSDGLFTPATPELFIKDIETAKSLGFNMLRKHIKLEPQLFYYYCDKLGMIVFQDMVNNGHYSFFRDTALPTVGLQKMSDKCLHCNKETRGAFIKSMLDTAQLLKNHPSVCYWTIFNEGWGQFKADEMYKLLKKADGTRFIDSTSGWFRRKKTDVDSRHVYFKKVKLKASDKPLVLSEFGGYSYKPEGHVFNTEQTYGYAKYESREDFVKAISDLYNNEILPLVPMGLCAAVYTQVSDVEDETNGILSYDREVLKIQPSEFYEISETVKNAVK
ncbi:MAG: glycoside hydrolase family 2 [Clostridia bacterium]|nr:glycoside hydrolase family 2 [Clostridia bacterium]